MNGEFQFEWSAKNEPLRPKTPQCWTKERNYNLQLLRISHFLNDCFFSRLQNQFHSADWRRGGSARGPDGTGCLHGFRSFRRLRDLRRLGGLRSGRRLWSLSSLGFFHQFSESFCVVVIFLVTLSERVPFSRVRRRLAIESASKESHGFARSIVGLHRPSDTVSIRVDTPLLSPSSKIWGTGYVVNNMPPVLEGIEATTRSVKEELPK